MNDAKFNLSFHEQVGTGKLGSSKLHVLGVCFSSSKEEIQRALRIALRQESNLATFLVLCAVNRESLSTIYLGPGNEKEMLYFDKLPEEVKIFFVDGESILGNCVGFSFKDNSLTHLWGNNTHPFDTRRYKYY